MTKLFSLQRILGLLLVGMVLLPVSLNAAEMRGPRSQPDTDMSLYAPEQHELYDGVFKITGRRIYQAGRLDEESPWDHMGDSADNLRPVGGEIVFDVNEIANSGTFLKICINIQ